MKKDLTIVKRQLTEIEKSVWYRQRFDACPHFMFFLGDAHISNIQHTKYPFGQRIAYAGFSKNRADWYHNLGELEFTASKIIEASTSNPNISRGMIDDFRPWQDRFYKECVDLQNKNLSAMSNTELLATYNELADTYTNKLNCSPLIDGFALSTDTVIASKIKVFLESIGRGDLFVEYCAVLTAPTFVSFLQEEEIALLNIAKKVIKNPDLENSLLKAHQANYFWIRNNYVKDYVEGVQQFKERLEAYTNIDIDKKIAGLESLAKDHAFDKQKLIHKISLPEEIVSLLRITDDFNAWQDERKKGTFWATHYFSLLLEEFSRRTNYSLDQLKYALPPEMSEILSQTIDASELDKRIQYCMVVWILDHYDVITDMALIEKLDRIGTGEHTISHEVKGFTASRGKVTGKVCVLVSADEIGKVEQGDVIVAVMTRPDYLPAMQRAAAFVTDEGGITCHAAIVARELKKPCIIGTKIATKVFKDGDIVEVDAEKGVVCILEK